MVSVLTVICVQPVSQAAAIPHRDDTGGVFSLTYMLAASLRAIFVRRCAALKTNSLSRRLEQ